MVQTTHLHDKRKWKILGLTSKSANDITFEKVDHATQETKIISVAEYFKQTYSALK